MILLALTERFFENYLVWIPRAGISILLFYLCLDFGGHHYRPETILRFFVPMICCFWLLLPFRKLPALGNLKYPLIIFLIFSFLSTLFSAYFHDSVLEWSNLVCLLIIFIVIYDLMSAPRYHYFFINYLLMIGLVECCIGLFYMMAFYKDKTGLYGTFYQIDVFGGFLLLFLPVSLALYLSEKDMKRMFLYAFLTGIYGICTVLTYSRGVLISLLVALIVFYLFIALRKIRYPDIRTVLLRSFIILAVVLVGSKLISQESLTDAVPERLKERAVEFMSEGDSSRSARWQFWVAAVKISLNHPLLGTGFKTFGRFYPPYEDDIRHFSKYPHSLYLQILCETGVVSFLAFLVLLYLLFRTHFKIQKEIDPESEGFHYYSHFGMGIGALGSFIHHLVDVDWFFVAIPAIWIAFFASSMGRTLRYTASGDERADAQGERDEDFLIAGLSRHMAIQFSMCLLLIIFSILLIPSFFAKKYAENGDALRERGKIGQAIDSYIQAIRLDPLESEFHRNLGNLYLMQGLSAKDNGRDTEYAEFYARKALALDPSRAVLHHFLGKIRWKKGLYDEALHSYQKALELDSRNYPSFYNDIAGYYAMKEDYKTAEKYYRDATRVFREEFFPKFWAFRADPTKMQLSGSYEGLGNIYLKDRKYREAEAFLEQAVKLDSKNCSALFGLGFARYRQAKYGDASVLFKQSVRIDPDFALAYLFLGYSCEKLGKPEEARSYILKAFELDPRLKKEPPRK